MITILAALVVSATSPDELVARVGAETISQTQLKERESATRARGGAPRLEMLLEDLINDALLAQDGFKAGLARDPEVVARVLAERARLAAERMQEKELTGAVKVTDEQISQTYHSSGDTARFNLIILASEETAGALLQRLRAGATFKSEANKSLDQAAVVRGGDSGDKMRAQLEPALAEAVFSAPIGALTLPIKLELGFGVLQVVSRQVAPEEGLVARREELRQYLQAQLRSQYRQHYVTQLRAASKVKIDEAFLRSTELRLTATPEEQDQVIATVAGKPIRYREALAQLVATVGGKEGGHFSGASVKLEFSWSVVDRALLEAAALDRGFGTDAWVEAGARRFERDEVVRANARRLRASAPQPSAAELQAWYSEHPADFATPAERTCSHLVVRERSHAEKLRERITRGEAFEELVREYSLDEGTASAGGLIGVLSDVRLASLEKTEPALARSLSQAKPNELSAPTQSKLGWHLVRCGATTPGGIRPLAQVREAIVARLRAEREARAVIGHLEKLRASTTITRNAVVLSKLPLAP